MEVVIADHVQEELEKADVGGVTGRQWLLSADAPDGLSFRLFRSHFQAGENARVTPRHHHGFQQIRWAESGSMNYGPGQAIEEGDLAYFPRGAYYGPQRRDHGIQVAIQFGFGPEMPGGKNNLRVHEEILEQLKTQGTVTADRVFVDIDPQTGAERRRDLGEVIAAKHTGKRYVIPPERYAQPILMHPKAYSYFDVAPGVEIKRLGSFYDQQGPNGNVTISMLRLSKGGAYRLGCDRAQVLWSSSSGLSIGGQTYPALTSIYSPRDETQALSAMDPVEVYLVEFPRLD
ncbi:hypothetical protein [Bradyrhizobium sp. 143]|uniref:hypothetical protein n=1 Tax=Bradyrhizobium sp. 143 TaxID=2782619 RepID=UPI001FFBDD3C|nr:hypothetical protein [Bradyrhizobium sp. 143]MCK1709847.1 hypothetical protein [Bradyrhizobium sp. 143]